MAERNNKLTPFEQEKKDTLKQIYQYKSQAESNVVAILYKEPEELYNLDLKTKDFLNNTWRVYFEILQKLVLEEGKKVVDYVTVGLYLEQHSKLKAEYEKQGGYDTIEYVMKHMHVKNLDAYIAEMHKWRSVLALCNKGFPVKDRLSDYADMTEEEIYREHDVNLNHIFSSSSFDVKSYNVFDNMYEFIDELNEAKYVGLPFYNAELLTAETGGFNINGNIYGLGAGSGVGKSTMAFNYLVPSALEKNEKIVFIINEEDESKLKKDLLVWVANNIFKKELKKHTLRDGGFDEETMALLRECADWIDEKKDRRILTVIPLERYSVSTVIKIIKKYSRAFGVRIFVLDTLKESCDAKTDEIYKSMMRDMIALYDVVKPSAMNVGLFVTYQLGKSSLKMRYLTNNEIGQAKSIIDVMSVNFMMRRPYEDEYNGRTKELKYYCEESIGKNSKSDVVRTLNENKNYMITFITKNRFGETGRKQIISECDLSTNVYKDLGHCFVPQDF